MVLIRSSGKEIYGLYLKEKDLAIRLNVFQAISVSLEAIVFLVDPYY